MPMATPVNHEKHSPRLLAAATVSCCSHYSRKPHDFRCFSHANSHERRTGRPLAFHLLLLEHHAWPCSRIRDGSWHRSLYSFSPMAGFAPSVGRNQPHLPTKHLVAPMHQPSDRQPSECQPSEPEASAKKLDLPMRQPSEPEASAKKLDLSTKHLVAPMRRACRRVHFPVSVRGKMPTPARNMPLRTGSLCDHAAAIERGSPNRPFPRLLNQSRLYARNFDLSTM